ncbi:MAG: ABC transporter permease [Anaerolineales bacterium]|nr:MAG: ABC transporter permease [Anaerolineales bacterium]
MRIFDLALKDLSQVFRDKRSLLFLVAMPIAFTFFMGFAYKSGMENDATQDNRIPLGWVNNESDGFISQRLFDMLSNSDSARLVELAPEEVDESVRKGEVAGVLIVPVGYSRQVAAGEDAQLTLVTDTNSTNGQSLYQILRTSVTKLMSAVEIAQLSAEAVGKPNDASELNGSFASASQAWSEADSASLVKVEVAMEGAFPGNWYGDNPYNQASPGILVQFAIMGLVASGQILVQERKTRTLQRLMSTTMRPWEIVAGHTLAMFGIVFAQITLLVVFGQLALGVDYMRAPLGTLLVSVALSLWVAAMGLLIGTVVKDDSQVILFALMAMFIFSALGGTWFPLEVASGTFAAIGKVMPSAWAMTGYQNILMRGLGSDSARMPSLILLAYALGFFILAVWRFRKMNV